MIVGASAKYSRTWRVIFAASGQGVSLAIDVATATGIGLDQPGDDKSFSANQSFPHRRVLE
jgi:hypothetical protein